MKKKLIAIAIVVCGNTAFATGAEVGHLALVASDGQFIVNSTFRGTVSNVIRTDAGFDSYIIGKNQPDDQLALAVLQINAGIRNGLISRVEKYDQTSLLNLAASVAPKLKSNLVYQQMLESEYRFCGSNLVFEQSKSKASMPKSSAGHPVENAQ